MAQVVECDQDGNPRIYYIVGGDPNDPQKVQPVVHEIRPGGMVVIKAVPERANTVAPDPAPPPSLAEIENERMQRAAEHAEQEAAALRAERGETEPEAEEETEEEPDEEAAAEAAARAKTASRSGAGRGRGRSTAKSR